MSQQWGTEGTEPCEAQGQLVAITPGVAEGLPSLAVCPLRVTYSQPWPPGQSTLNGGVVLAWPRNDRKQSSEEEGGLRQTRLIFVDLP